MKRSLSLWQLGGVTFTAVLGTLLHFLYGWTDILAFAPFCAVNESAWEHMKILFFPMLIFALIQSRFFKEEYQNFWCVKLVGIVFGTALIPVLFYTLNGSFGKTPDWVNIAIFFVAAGGGYLLEGLLFKRVDIRCKSPVFAVVILLLIAALFIVFTFFALKIPLFQDPLTGTYGLQR